MGEWEVVVRMNLGKGLIERWLCFGFLKGSHTARLRFCYYKPFIAELADVLKNFHF